MRRIKQIEESKKMISDALLKLLQDKSMDEITVSQITTKAKIGRNTFYNHFQKKEDILDYLMQGYLEGFKDKLGQNANPSVRDILFWRFNIIKENPLLIIFQKHNDIKQLLFNFRDKNIAQLNLTVKKDVYITDFYHGGIDYVTSRWIDNDMKESPEEMADKILLLINK